MKYLSSTLFIIFFATTILGFVAMADMNHPGGCVVATLNGVSCLASPIDFATEHIKAYNTFSGITISVLFSLALLLVSLLVTFSFRVSDLSKLRSVCLRQFAPVILPKKRQKDFYWFSLLTFSPPLN